MNVKREEILDGRMEAFLVEAERQGIFKRMTPEDREISKQKTLSLLPPGKDVWLFGYGSLMWNPTIHYVERRAAKLYGYHRQFCLWTHMGRGTPEQPGLMLGLQSGGSCNGIAYRVEADIADHELSVVWNREMVSGAYVPKIVQIRTNGAPVNAIAFVINQNHDRYAGRLPDETIVDAIAKAEGPIGRCCNYLFNTVENLDELGIGDGPMHSLCRAVRKRLEE